MKFIAIEKASAPADVKTIVGMNIQDAHTYLLRTKGYYAISGNPKTCVYQKSAKNKNQNNRRTLRVHIGANMKVVSVQIVIEKPLGGWDVKTKIRNIR